MKIEVCNGTRVSEKKLKKRFKKLRKEAMKAAADMGLTKRDLKRLKKGEELPTPKDENAIMAVFTSVFPEYFTMD